MQNLQTCYGDYAYVYRDPYSVYNVRLTLFVDLSFQTFKEYCNVLQITLNCNNEYFSLIHFISPSL